MSKLKVDVGKTFGKLTVIKKVAPGKYGTKWLCRCECKNELEVYASNLKDSSSCGCSKDYHQFKIPITNTTGIKGVSPFRRKGEFKGYRASLFHKGKTISGKVRTTVEEAAEDRLTLEKEYLDNRQ